MTRTANSFLLFIALFIACRNTAIKSPGSRALVPEDSVSSKWKQDSVGCKHLRSKDLAAELLKTHNLLQDVKEKFLETFGAPNSVEKKEDQEILVYYFDTMCGADGAISRSDKCYARFYFKSNRLIDSDFICE